MYWATCVCVGGGYGKTTHMPKRNNNDNNNNHNKNKDSQQTNRPTNNKSNIKNSRNPLNTLANAAVDRH